MHWLEAMSLGSFSPTNTSSAAPISLRDGDASDYGDSLIDAYGRMHVFSHAEDSEKYDFGEYYSNQYYPICIGEMLIDRYIIVHKLGYGSFSTVWLARDTKEERDVALKILITGDQGEYEYSMQQEIMNTVRDTPNLVTYLETFSLPGRKGNHRVLVFTVRGPSFSCLQPKQISSVANRMSAARDLLKALECLQLCTPVS